MQMPLEPYYIKRAQPTQFARWNWLNKKKKRDLEKQ